MTPEHTAALDVQAAPRPQRAGLERLSLRRLRPDDAPGVAQMMNDLAVLPGTLQLPFTEPAAWTERLADNAGGSAQAAIQLGAFEGEALVATAGLHPVGLAVRRRHAMSLGITVDREWQGKGVGDWLMATLCHHADRWLAVLRIELYVYADNARAIALYEKHGFEVEGLHRAYSLRDGQYADTLAMARLNPNPPRWRTAACEA